MNDTNRKIELTSPFQKKISMLLVISDILSLLLSMLVGYIVRFNTSVIESIPAKMMTLEPRRLMPGDVGGPMAAELVYLITALALVPLWLFLFKYYGLYREKRSSSKIDNWLTIIRAITVGVLIFLVSTFFFRNFTYSRVVLIFFWVVNIVFTITGRMIIRGYQAEMRKKGFDRKRAILVGHSHVGDVLHRDMISRKELGFDFSGWIDDNPPDNRKVIGSFKELPALVDQFKPVDVFIVEPQLDRDIILNLISQCDQPTVRFRIVSGLFEILTNRSMERISGFPMIDFGSGFVSPFKQKVKRIFDICCALCSMFMFSPLFVVIPILIRWKVGGPVFFKQQRVGKDGKLFTIYKFSSMYHNSNPYAPAPSSLDDKRITPIGRFLRRTSLDEIPQFINVLKGEMSIVGPRPEMPFLAEKQNNWQKIRTSVKPGMTGVWQTMGRSELPLQDHLEFDFFYVRNQSLIYDLQIIFRTILVVIFGKGAY